MELITCDMIQSHIKVTKKKINAWRLKVVSQWIYNDNSGWLEKGSSYQK